MSWIRVAVLLFPAFGCCAAPITDSVRLSTKNLYGIGVHLQYPAVIGVDAARLNPLIERWVGAECSQSPMIRNTNLRHDTYLDAKACVTALSRQCAAWQAASGRSVLALSPCQAEITVAVKTETADLLVMELSSYGSTDYGTVLPAHPGSDTEYLNLDIRTGRALGVGDLLKFPYQAALQSMILRSLRAEFHIPANEKLTQAGFDNDYPPIPRRVEVLSKGLLFAYQSSELTFPAGAPPKVLVSYTALSSLIPENGPLSRFLDSSGQRH